MNFFSNKHYKLAALMAFLTGVLVAIPRSSLAADLYWDANDITAGAGATPTGIWGTDPFWSTLADGTEATGPWVAGSTAIFSAGADATGPFSVTVSGTHSASALVIEEGAVTLATGTVALGTGNLTVHPGATLSTDSSLRISASPGATVTINGGTLRTTNPGNAGTFYDADFAITLGPLGATFSHITPSILNIVQTATTITGEGGLTKTGVGVLAIAGTATYLGGTTINEGELRIRGTANRLPITTAVTVNSPGILNLNGVSQQIGSLSGNGDVGTGSATLTVGDDSSTTFSGAIKNIANAGANGVASGNGRVVKLGSGALTLTGSNAYSGSLTISNGTVTAAADSVLCDPLADIIVQGGVLNLSNAAQTILSLSGNGGIVQLGSGHALTVNPSSTRTYAGTVQGGGSLTKSGTGTLTLSGDNSYGGGTTVSGGTLRVSNTAGSGTGTGPVNVLAGGTLGGPGNVAGAITLAGTIAPGASPGTLNSASQTWSAGGSYLWEINDSDAGAGTDPGWDLINITGGLTIEATPANKFNINITSLTSTNTAGAVEDFDNTTDYTWTILKTTTGITGFDATAINLNTSGFANALGNGLFVVELANGGNDLVVRFVHPPTIVTGPTAATVECGGSHTFTVTASGTEPLSYQWRWDGSPIGTGNSLTTSQPGTYEVQVSNAYGSVTAPAVPLTVVDTTAPTITCPAPIIASADAGQCSAASVTYAASATDACSTPSVACMPPSGSSFAVGTHTVTCTATDVSGNTNACTFTVTINDTELPTITAPVNVTVCADAGQTFATGVVLGTPAAADNCSVTVSNDAPAQFPVGATTVTWTATDASGNSATAAQTVTVNGNPVVSVNSATICDGASATLTATTDASNPTYLWSPGGATTASITVSPSTTTTYTVTVTDGTTTCSASASGTVTVSPLSNVSVNSETICAGNSTTLTATTDAANPSFLWSPGGETTASITVSPASTTTYSVTVTDGNSSCSRSASGTVTVTPSFALSVNSATVCAGGSATLTATTDAVTPSYLWSPGGETTASISVSPTDTTTYTVTISDANTGCSRAASGTVTVNQGPEVTIDADSICTGESVEVRAITTAANPSFLWSPGGETNSSFTVTLTSNTTYTVTVTDGVTGCSTTTSETVQVRGFESFANASSITIADGSSAVPYPSQITVSGLTATVCRVTVTLNNLSHAFPDDIDLLLMGPNGEGVLLMSDVGGADALSGVTLTFDDGASGILPDASQIVSGTYKPSNIGSKADGNPDNFPAPVPNLRFGTDLSVFNGIIPNGDWQLFAFDDELVDAGEITGGWSLAIATDDPFTDMGVSIADIPDPVAVGSNLTYTVVVTNIGPSVASPGLYVTLPSGPTLVSVTASQGSCTTTESQVTCLLDPVNPGASATVTIVVTPQTTGTLDLSALITVSGALDFNPSNFSASASTTVRNPPVITTAPMNQIVCADGTATFSVTATGDEPLSYQWYFGTDALAGETGTSLVLANAQPPQSGSYSVVVNNDVGAASASATLTVNPLPSVAVNSPTICIGDSATLTASTDAANPTYLWSPGGETTASIAVSPTATTGYSVLVTDGVTGCTNSASATVTVNQLTTASALTSVTNACPGTAVTFATIAGGTGPFTYVWRKDNVVITDATADTLTLASVSSADAGTYCVEVTGACNTATSCATVTIAAPPVIASQPQNQIAPMGNSATFSVTATGPEPLTYQWQLNETDIPGATDSSFTVSGAILADNGTRYRVIVSNCADSTTSTAATLTVTPIAGISFDFDTPGQFTNTPYNVQLNDWLHTALPALMIESLTGGIGDSGSLDLTGTADNSMILHPVSYDFSLDGKTLVASTLVRIVAPTQNTRNTQIGFVTSTNAYAGNPPGRTAAGIADNNPQGFMAVILQSTAQPALTYQLRLQHRRTDGGIAEVTPTPTPQATLVAGTWYKLVATFANIKGTAANTFTVAASLQDMGADGLTPGGVAMSYPAVNVVNPSIVNQKNMHLALRTARSDSGADRWDNIHAYATPGPVAFVAQPASQTVPHGRTATFYALVDGEGPYTYQWNLNGNPIPGARSWKYITPSLTTADNGGQYSVTVTGPNNSVTSDSAALTVQPDALAVVSVGSVDGGLIGVQFNQPVDRATAENPANYSVDGVTATAARVYVSTADPTPTRVIVTPGSVLTGPYTVTVSGVLDLSGNAIGVNNSAAGRVEGLVGVDVRPEVASPPGQQYSFAPAQFEVFAGGTDIFGAPDAFHYVYTKRTGDFDIKARVPYQDVVRTPTKTGFDARISLDPSAPHVLAAVNPKWPARGLYEGTFRQAYNVGGTSWGAAGTSVTYPDAWLRFRRVGNTFLRYSSQNGATWQLDGQITPVPPLPDTMYVGLAVCSVANGNQHVGQFDSYGDFGGYPGATIEITAQPISSATVAAGSSTNLSVTATLTGAPASELTYVWQRRQGAGDWMNVDSAGQTNAVFNTGPLFAADSGAQYRVIVKAAGAADVISSETTIIVNDGVAPTLTSATVPGLASYEVVLVFSEPVSAVSATVAANYVVTNAAGVDMGVASAVLGSDSRTVLLTTSTLLAIGNYGVRVSNVQDLQGNSIAANTLRVFSVGTPAPAQPVMIEYFGDVTGGGAVSLLTAHAKFTGNLPDFIAYNNSFNWTIAPNVDNYGIRMTTYFVPASTGLWRFWIRNDDQAQMFMNTNAVNSTDPAGKVMLANITAVNANYVNAVQNVHLIGGQRYYLELLLKENTGGDFASLAVRPQSNSTTPPNTEFISGNLLAYPSGIAPATPVAVELYRGPTGNQIADQLNAYNTPNFIAGVADLIAYEKSFAFVIGLGNSRIDNYLGRLSANFVAPSNGLYKFYIRSDDSSQFFMNTNEINSTDPAGKVLLGQLNNFIGTGYTLAAQNVYLNGGQRYFMEGLWKEGTGGDGMSVAVRAQSDNATPPGTESIPASMLELPITGRAGAVSLAGVSPANPVVTDGQTLTFSAVGIGGAPPYTFTWLKNGYPVFANASAFTTQPLSAADHGAEFTLVVNNAFSSVSRSATVTVLADNAPPTLVSAMGLSSLEEVVVTFSEPVDPASAAVIANYRISGLAIYDADLDAAGTRLNLRTSPQAPGANYTLTVNGVRDRASTGNTIAPDSSIDFAASSTGGAGLFVELFFNIGGTAVANLLADPRVINNLPDVTGYIPNFAHGTSPQAGVPVHNIVPAMGNVENYGARLSGYFTPPTTGLYRFYIRGDDGTQLFMNTNGPSAQGRVLIARNDGANSSTYDNGTGGSASPILSLDAGTAYYAEALMKEGGGGDYVTVAFREIDRDTLTAIGGIPPNTESASGVFFQAPGSASVNRFIISQAPPAELNATEGEPVDLALIGDIIPPSVAPAARYQWQKFDASASTFTNIPGGNAATLSFFASLEDDGAQYRIDFSMPGTNVSYVTTLHVAPDMQPPFLVAASSLAGTNIDLAYSERVDSSGIDNFNYVITGADGQIATIVGGIQHSDQRKVTMMLETNIVSPFVVEAFAIVDLSTSQNAGDSSITGRVRGFQPTDVGGPAVAGSSYSAFDDEFDVIAGGADIWGASDQGHLTLSPRFGDFDIHARVHSLSRAPGDDNITKAGLMVRETLAANSRTLYYSVNPPASAGGRDLGEAGQRLNTGAATALWPGSASYTPAGIPNAWLRIKRTGQVYTAYRSANGVDWTAFATASLNSGAEPVLVGLATTAHFATGSTLAEYRDVYIPDTPTIVTQPSPATQIVPLHGSVTYSVLASNPPNSGTLVYQWKKDGVSIPGATSDTYTINDVLGSDAGVYTVWVGNDGGATISAAATLQAGNDLPIATTDSLSTTQNVAIAVSAADLLANDSDPNGGTLSLVAVSGVYPVTYTADFNAGLPAGSSVWGSAVADASGGGVDNSGALKLTANANNQSGGFVLNELSPGRRVSAFVASFKLRIGNGSTEPADGFSFNLAHDAPVSATGPRVAEDGMGTGLSFIVDNYRFTGAANTSGLRLRYNGIEVGTVQTEAWDQDAFVPVTVSLSYNGVVTVFVDGTNVFGNVNIPYVQRPGRFGLYARTGGQNQAHTVDDLSITQALSPDTARPDSEFEQPYAAAAHYGTAFTDNGILHLTDNLNNSAGGYLLNELTPAEPVTSFTATFKVRFGNGSAEPADGFSFNFANDLPEANVGPRAAEDGMGSGFSFCVDHYRFAPYPTGGTANTSGMKIRYNGADIAGVQIATWNNAAFIPVSITVASDGALTVLVDGTNVFGAITLPSWTPARGRFGLYARTGGLNIAQWVDDLDITANTATAPGRFVTDFGPGQFATVVLNNGTITYTPQGDGCGSDTFYYLVNDGQTGGTSIGQVNVHIAEANPTPPTIAACADNVTVSAAANCQIALPDLTTQLIVNDNCCCPALTQDPPAGTLLNVGTTTVTFTATDAEGLTAQCQATITVIDGAAPLITLIGSDTMIVECHSDTIIPGATASDNCSGDLTASIVVTGSADVNVPGTYTIRYNVSDAAGNPAVEVVRTVHVIDTLAPSITCPADMTVTCTSANGAQVDFVVNATDACDATVTVVCTPASGSTFALGTHTVTCVATDDAGLTNSCAFSVTVEGAPDASLAIVKDGDNVIVSWTKTCGEYGLQAAEKLGDPWAPVPDVPVEVNGRFQVTLPATGESKFFRLVQ